MVFLYKNEHVLKLIKSSSGGLVYITYTKYLEILNQAFGAGGWRIIPRGEPLVTKKVVTREYALICHDRYVPLSAKFHPRPSTEMLETPIDLFL